MADEKKKKPALGEASSNADVSDVLDQAQASTGELARELGSEPTADAAVNAPEAPDDTDIQAVAQQAVERADDIASELSDDDSESPQASSESASAAANDIVDPENVDAMLAEIAGEPVPKEAPDFQDDTGVDAMLDSLEKELDIDDTSSEAIDDESASGSHDADFEQALSGHEAMVNRSASTPVAGTSLPPEPLVEESQAPEEDIVMQELSEQKKTTPSAVNAAWPPDDSASSDGTPVLSDSPLAALAMPQRVVACGLDVMNRPFEFISPESRDLVGMAAIITTIMTILGAGLFLLLR